MAKGDRSENDDTHDCLLNSHLKPRVTIEKETSI
jgi:hypothetical protein